MAINAAVQATSKRKSILLQEIDVGEVKYEYPKTFHVFKEQLKSAFYSGAKEAQREMSALPRGFKEILLENSCWECPYAFDISHDYIMKNIPTYDKIGVKVTFPNQSRKHLDEDGDKLNDSDDAYDKTDHQSECPETSGFYIKKSGSQIHIDRALKLAIRGKDYIYKERSKRHRSEKHLQGLKPIPESHNILPGQEVAVSLKRDGQWCNIMRILSMRSKSDGYAHYSASKSCDIVFWGLMYEVDKNSVFRPAKTLLSSWIPVRKIACHVQFVTTETGCFLDEDSIDQLKEIGYDYSNQLHHSDDTSVPAIGEPDKDGYYEVEDILDKKIDKSTHEELYLVSFKGYNESENAWLPGATFKHPVQFYSRSSRGRRRVHKTFGSNFVDETMTKGSKINKKRKCTDIEEKTNEMKKRKKDNQQIKHDNNHIIDTLSEQMAPWGGTYSGEEISPLTYKLINTCPIDNILSILYVLYHLDPVFKELLQQSGDNTMEQFLRDSFEELSHSPTENNWAKTKYKWIIRTCDNPKISFQKNINCQILDCHGTEFDLIGRSIVTSTLGETNGRKQGTCLLKTCNRTVDIQMRGLHIESSIQR